MASLCGARRGSIVIIGSCGVCLYIFIITAKSSDVVVSREPHVLHKTNFIFTLFTGAGGQDGLCNDGGAATRFKFCIAAAHRFKRYLILFIKTVIEV